MASTYIHTYSYIHAVISSSFRRLLLYSIVELTIFYNYFLWVYICEHIHCMYCIYFLCTTIYYHYPRGLWECGYFSRSRGRLQYCLSLTLAFKPCIDPRKASLNMCRQILQQRKKNWQDQELLLINTYVRVASLHTDYQNRNTWIPQCGWQQLFLIQLHCWYCVKGMCTLC